MRHITLAVALAALAVGAAVSGAQADNYYGPHQRGNLCWHRQGGGDALGYWGSCEESRTAATRTRAGASKGRNAPATGTAGQGRGGAEYQ
jgi:hypothetical protein